MKLKNGFTLIELIFVIVLLGLLSLLIVPNINKFVANSKDKLLSAQIKSVADSSLNFITDYYEDVSELSTFTIDLKLLKDLAYVESDIKNPKTEKYFSDESLIKFTKKNNTYISTFYPIDSDSVSDIIKYSKHIVLLKDGNTYIGSNYKSSNNVVVVGINGGVYTSSRYSVSVTNLASTINSGYQTVTYNVSLTESLVNYIYTIKRDEKSS